MTTIGMSGTRRVAEALAPRGSRLLVALLWGAAVPVWFGPVLAGGVHIAYVWLLAWQWLVVGGLAWWIGAAHPRVARAVLVLAASYAATMSGVFAVRWAAAPVGTRATHPGFGGHAVLERAGFPWPGVEGNGHGDGMDRIPFAMGLDALAVNLLVFALLFGWAMRRWPAARVRAWLVPMSLVATMAGLLGAWRLIVLFD